MGVKISTGYLIQRLHLCFGIQLDKISTKCQPLYPCFIIQQSDGTKVDALQPKRKRVIQDDGLKASTARCSAPRQDTYDIRTAKATETNFKCMLQIPTDTPTLLLSGSPLRLRGMPCDLTGSGKIQDDEISYKFIMIRERRLLLTDIVSITGDVNDNTHYVCTS
jgi:hypothetical protein